MPTYHVRNVPVEFPYEAYESQLVYMDHVMGALQNGENAILESPTGTGKTLCLLTTCLAWTLYLRAKRQEEILSKPFINSDLGIIKEKTANSNSNSTFNTINSSSLSSSNRERQENFNKNLTFDKIPSSSPSSSFSQIPLIIYASRTHSQLAQVIKELKRTFYHPKISIAGSREQMCINEPVRELNGAAAQAAMCAKVIKRCQCEYYKNVSFTAQEMQKGNSNSDSNSFSYSHGIMDMEDMISFAKQHNSCPFFLSRELAVEAEIIFMPYNYLLDNKSRGILDNLNLKGAIVIFDEAHNLESSCGDATSFELSTDELEQCLLELKRLDELSRIIPFSTLDHQNGKSDEICQPKEIISKLLNQINLLPLDQTGQCHRNGDFIFHLLSLANVTFENASQIESLFGNLGKSFIEDQFPKKSRSKCALQHFESALKTIFNGNESNNEGGMGIGIGKDANSSSLSNSSFNSSILTDSKYYRVFVNKEDAMDGSKKTKRILSYWCFNPGVAMKSLMALGPSSVILTSGTLSPIESFKAEFQLSFKYELENIHIINPRQILAHVIKVGPNSITLDSSFSQRDRNEYKRELGMTILAIVDRVPDGVLVFFPSYALMEASIAYWDQVRILNDLQLKKPVIIEPKSKLQLNSIIENYNRLIESGKGAILFAVCRGKISEGIDFPDNKARAVIVTGLPFPPLKDPKVVLKRQYLQQISSVDSKYLSSNDWYSQQAYRAVNQAIGRVIRHRNDYGSVFLCDQRFSSMESIGMLSRWIRDYFKNGNSFNSGIIGNENINGKGNGNGNFPISTTTFHSLGSSHFNQVLGQMDSFFKMNKEHQQMTLASKGKNVNSIINNSNSMITGITVEETKRIMCVTNDGKEGELESFQRKLDHTSRKINEATERKIVQSTHSINQQYSNMNGTRSLNPSFNSNSNQNASENGNGIGIFDKEKSQEEARKYLARIKEELSEENRRKFNILLRNYRAREISISDLVPELKDLIGIDNQQLLEGFKQFLPLKHQKVFDSILLTLSLNRNDENIPLNLNSNNVNRNNSSINNGNGKIEPIKSTNFSLDSDNPIEIEPTKEALELLNGIERRNGKIIISEIPKEKKCSQCNEKLKAPFKAKCGHICCFLCWKSWLERCLECPLCRRRTRLNHLVKIYQ